MDLLRAASTVLGSWALGEFKRASACGMGAAVKETRSDAAVAMNCLANVFDGTGDDDSGGGDGVQLGLVRGAVMTWRCWETEEEALIIITLVVQLSCCQCLWIQCLCSCL